LYVALFIVLKGYWRDNGGFRAWVSSPFFHGSFLFSVLYLFNVIDFEWREVARNSLPTILGFSLAAYTITFTLMGSALHRALSAAIDKKVGIPLIRIVNASFFHVILFQAFALLFALSTKGDFFIRHFGSKAGASNYKELIVAVTCYGGAFVGCFLTIYAIFLLISVGIAMFRLGALAARPPRVQVAEKNTVVNLPTADITNTLRFSLIRKFAQLLRLYN
jgi:hypothetical protein